MKCHLKINTTHYVFHVEKMKYVLLMYAIPCGPWSRGERGETQIGKKIIFAKLVRHLLVAITGVH